MGVRLKCEYRTGPRDEATERLECYIMQKRLAPHSKLPSERDLCKMWGVNRTTLRGAANRLIREGKLYKQQGSGTYVSPPKLMRCLQDTKSTSETLYSAGYTLRTEELNKCVIKCNKFVSQKLHLLLGAKAMFLRRLRIIDNEPAMIEVTYLRYDHFPKIEQRDFSKCSLYEVLSENSVWIESGRETIGITYANNEEAGLLKIAENTPLFFLRGISCGKDREPIEYFETVARSDKLSFMSVLTS